MLNQTLIGSESDLLISIGMVLGAIALQPVNAAFERLAQMAGRRDFQAHTATVDLRVQFNQTQFGQAILMIDDAATLTHALHANEMPAPLQLLWVHGLK